MLKSVVFLAGVLCGRIEEGEGLFLEDFENEVLFILLLLDLLLLFFKRVLILLLALRSLLLSGRDDFAFLLLGSEILETVIFCLFKLISEDFGKRV